jgi:hypothetical protein
VPALDEQFSDAVQEEVLGAPAREGNELEGVREGAQGRVLEGSGDRHRRDRDLLRGPVVVPVRAFPRGARERRHHPVRRRADRAGARPGGARAGHADHRRPDPRAGGATERDAARFRRDRRNLGRVGASPRSCARSTPPTT